MKCHNLRKLYIDYIEGTLESEKRNFIEAHLSECAECAQAIKDVRHAARVLGTETDPSCESMVTGIEAPDVVVARAERKYRKQKIMYGWAPAAVAAMLIIIVGIIYVDRERPMVLPISLEEADVMTLATVSETEELEAVYESLLFQISPLIGDEEAVEYAGATGIADALDTLTEDELRELTDRLEESMGKLYGEEGEASDDNTVNPFLI